MSALSKLIVRCTIRQFQQARTAQETADILARTIAFAEGDSPYIAESDIDSIIPYVPVTEPEQAVEDVDYSKMTKAELLALAEERGVEASDSMTKAEIVALLG